MSTAIKKPDAKPEPTQARARARRDAILKAANTYVLAGQIDRVTTTSVAKRAGIPIGSVYRYFDGRVDILDQLYRTAYAEIEDQMKAVQQSVRPDMPITETISFLLNSFTVAARSHANFRALTRWANQHYSLWDVTPGTGSNLAAFLEKTLTDGGVSFAPDRQEAAAKTIVTVVSVLVDQSLEEEDEVKAKVLIDELGYLLNQYLQ